MGKKPMSGRGSLVILAVSMLPLQSFAEETGSDSSHHYFAFASDLHADPDHLFEDARSVLSGTVKGFPEEINYFSLLGDIAGDGDTAPEYKANEIYGAAAVSMMPMKISCLSTVN